MNKTVIYKSGQEHILMQELAESSMISLEELYDIKKYYNNNVPYHNFLHALTVAEKVLELSSKKYNIIEVRSLFLAALFHDAGHSGTAEGLDEFRSLDIAFENIEKFGKEYNYKGIDFSIVRKAIIGTVFKNRGKNSDKYARILADLDIHTLGLDFYEFLYYCDFGMALEIGQSKNGELDIEEWFGNVGYFKFLVGINKKIFLNQDIQDELTKNALNNISKYLEIKNNSFKTGNNIKIIDIFKYWKNNDITLEEFKEKFFL